ncbi:MAG: hypothetical protein GTN40_03325 [Candidatus Aenigmarchaeota archaeon]|nr:hypothetical protein [Candidatus Aenigmarchaeota archaeon]
MLTIELQKEVKKELERICADSRINYIRKLHEAYTFKYSRYYKSSPSFPCNSVCNPRNPNEVFDKLEDSDKFGTKDAIYTDTGDSFNNICFPRCGNVKDYPNCDKTGAIDVRFLGYFNEFELYYSLRPTDLILRDGDAHPESLETHKILRSVFELQNEAEIVKKIDSIL